MEHPTIELIKKYKLIERAVISSFNPLVLKKVKAINQKIITAQLLDQRSDFSSLMWLYISKPNFVHLNINQINNKLIQKLKKQKYKIFAYTVNNLKEFNKAKIEKLDGIFTDYPQKFT